MKLYIDLVDMYDDYIYGQKELADINREFSEKHAGCVIAGRRSITFFAIKII